MPIYTKSGDRGETSLYGGKRISKSSLQVETYGSIDELTSNIGLTINKVKEKETVGFLTGLQKELYSIMAYLSGAPVKLARLDKSVLNFEKRIDNMEKKLPKLTRFILPQGTELSVLFHILRIVCRRAERNTVRYFNEVKIKNFELKIIKYLNRLSDLFFTFARYYNKGHEVVT